MSHFIYACLIFFSRLWHQLTIELDAFTKDSSNSRGDNFLRVVLISFVFRLPHATYVQLYNEFIKSFEAKLSQIKLIHIVIACSAQMCPSRPVVEAEFTAALSFLVSFEEKKVRLGEEAALILQMEIARLKLLAGDIAAVKVGRVLVPIQACINRVYRILWRLEKLSWIPLRGLYHQLMQVTMELLPSFTRYCLETHLHMNFTSPLWYLIFCVQHQGPAASFYANGLELINYMPEGSMSDEQVGDCTCGDALSFEQVYTQIDWMLNLYFFG